MCGLLGKLRLGILETVIEDIDIVCVCETKLNSTNDYAQTLLPSHRILFKKEKSDGRLSGTHGLAILVNKRFQGKVTLIDDFDSCEHVMWVKVMLNENVEFILGNVYIPHEGSIHYDDEWYTNVSSDMIALGTLALPFVLVGDFNSRTGRLDDFMEYDENVARECGVNIELDLPGVSNGKDYLESIGIFTRHNKDGHINNNGRKLIELCQIFNLNIINGRFGTDREHGDFTCRTAQGQSTIDYIIMSSEMLPIIKDFTIDPFDSCLSDAHCSTSLTLIDSHTIEKQHLKVS